MKKSNKNTNNPKSTSKEKFFSLLNKSAMASEVKEVEKKESQTSDNYNEKKIRRRKIEDTSDLHDDKGHAVIF